VLLPDVLEAETIVLLPEAAGDELLEMDALLDRLAIEELEPDEAEAEADTVELEAETEDVLATVEDALAGCEASEDWITLRMLDGIHVVSKLE